MCGSISQGSDQDKLNDSIKRQRDASGIRKTMNTYGKFFNDAAKTPANILEIKNNVDRRNARLKAIMDGDIDPASY